MRSISQQPLPSRLQTTTEHVRQDESAQAICAGSNCHQSDRTDTACQLPSGGGWTHEKGPEASLVLCTGTREPWRAEIAMINAVGEGSGSYRYGVAHAHSGSIRF